MNTKRLLFPIVIFIAVLSIFPLQAIAEEKEKRVVATGFADGTDANARDRAIDDAQRQAVKQAMGSFIETETIVENMILIEDRVYTETKGYIKNYEILEEGPVDGTYKVKISALVKLDRLASDLESIGLLIRKKQNPRVMVVLYSKEIARHYFDYLREGNQNISNRIESGLMKKGFEIVDAGQVSHKKDLEDLLAGGDYIEAGKAAKNFGAEVLVSGDVRRVYVSTKRLYGRNTEFFSNDIRLKALETDTAKVLYSGSRTKPPSGINYLVPLEEASSELVEEMTAGILEKWRKDVYQTGTFQINLSGANFKDISMLKKELKKIRGFGGVQTRNFQSDKALLEVKYKGSVEELAEKLSEIRSPALEITALQSNTIDARILKK